MRKKLTIKDHVSVVEYVSAVKNMSNAFFDELNEYTPHYGRMEVFFTFFSLFVDGDSIESHFEGQQIDEEFLLTNEDCLALFKEAISSNNGYKLDFANAYMDAMEIVNTRKTSLYNAVEIVKQFLSTALDSITSMLNEDNIEALTKVAKDFSAGNINADSIVEAYMNKQSEIIS